MPLKRRVFLSAALLVLILSLSLPAQAAAADPVTVYYFHGIGCPHCTKVDAVLFPDWLANRTDLVVIEYEVWQDTGNAEVLNKFDTVFKTQPGIPVMFLPPTQVLQGDTEIISTLPGTLDGLRSGGTTSSGSAYSFSGIDLTALGGNPHIWYRDRVLIRTGPGGDSESLKALLLQNSVDDALKGVSYETMDPLPVNLSMGPKYFKNAARLDGWIFEWNESSFGASSPGVTETQASSSTPATTPATPLAYAPFAACALVLIMQWRKRR